MKVAFLRFLADDSIVFRPHPVNGKQYTSRRPDPGIRLEWEPAAVGVARSADLGWTTGPYRVYGDEESTPPLSGHFVSLWARQPNRRWKVIVDLGTEDPAGAACPEPPELALAESVVSRARAGALDLAAVKERLLQLERDLSAESVAGSAAAAMAPVFRPDVRLYRDGHCPALGEMAALELVAARPGRLSWAPIDARVATSGDLAYTYGEYSLTEFADDREPLETGYFVRVWRREPDAAPWKIALDLTSPVPPAGSPEAAAPSG